MDVLRVKDRTKLPERCPVCDYAWQGLEVGRCPECGEGEEVVHGRSAVGAKDFSPTWVGNLLPLMGASVVLVPVIHYLRHESWQRAAVFGAMAAAGALVIGIAMWWTTKRRGYPLGVLRLSAMGFQRGSGTTRGKLHLWRPGMRVTVRKRCDGEWRFRCERQWLGAGLYPAFDVIAECTEQRAAGVVERLHAWGVGMDP